MSMSKQKMVVEWSPHDTSLFAVGADNLRLFETTTTGDAVEALTTQRKRSFRLVKINAQITQLKCMEWYPFESKPLFIAAGMGSGKVLLSDFQDPRSRAVREFVPKYSRPCNAVAWNKALPNQLAAGFEKVRSDFCTLVWDLNTSSGAGAGASTISGNVSGNLEMMNDNDGGMDVVSGSMMMGSSSRKQHSIGTGSGSSTNNNNGANGSGGGARSFTRENEKPVHELSNSEATVALSWVPSQPMCLATGTGFKWLRVYDLRTKGVSSSPLSVVAHNKAVLGVVFDQHRPHILATYTDGPQEAVKVWDIRRLDSSAGPLLSLQQTSKTLAQVSWCPSKPGILVTTSAEEKWISLWDVTKHETADGTPSSSGIVVKKPFRRRYTSDPLVSFSWQHVSTTKPLPQQHQQQQRSREAQATANANAIKTIASAAFPNRLLIASVNGEIEDISVHDSMPVTVSSHGAVAFSCGRLLFGGSLSEDANTRSHGTAAAARNLLDAVTGERSNVFGDDEDISSEMYRLAKRSYSIELSKSLKLFQNGTSARHRQLRNLWLWVDQVEALRRIRANRIAQTRAIAAGGAGGGVLNATAPGPLRGWPFNANALVVAGVKNLLAVTTESPTPASSSAENAVSSSSSAESSSLANIASAVKMDPVLSCQVYEGLGRRLALLACNWDPDNGQSNLRNTSQSGFESNLPLGPGRPHLSLNRSNSGAWASQKQFEDSTLNSNVFGNRSGSESGRHELRSILSKCESEGQYARAAALAVFHGDLNAAVSFLQKGAMWLSQVQSNLQGEGASPVSHLSADILQLVAMAVAGYSSSTMNVGGPSLWATMCQQLLKRDEIVSQRHPRYLHALLSFLCVCAGSSSSNNPLNLPSARGVQPQAQPPRRAGATNNNTRRSWGSVDGLSVFTGGSASKLSASGMYSAILSDTTLPLSDRVAFACRYLPADDLRAFVTQHEDECEQFGRLEGLILTGLNATGTRILQTYLDTTGDIQTLALLAARLPSSLVNQQTRPQLSNWIVIYQDLLNQWQLFHERARLDVGRSQLEDVLNGFANFARDPDGEELQAELLAPSSITVPPQLYVRCNFCNASLSLSNLLRQGGSHSSWLNRAKPKLTCCPSCRKPLPQCALCLLPFGSLNPYFELAHRRSKQIAEAVASAVTNATMESASSTSTSTNSGMVLDEPSGSKAAGEHENLAQLSSIPFVEWFTWCQSCKHGGHAHHLADWFKSHSACPVTDCECQCQYLDLPIMLNNKQNEIIAQQQQAAVAAAAAAAAAAQRTIGSQSNKKQSHHHHQHEHAPSKRSGTKHGSIAGTPQQQAAAASSLTTSSSFRMLPPSRSTLGFQSKLSSSSSVLAPGNTMNAGLANLGGNGGGASSVNSNGSGSGTVDGMPMSMSMSLGNKLDQLEQKDKSGAYKYM
uniref:Uncharacterized protein n=1 Tax=Globisporangium ultimum (strain ATCC 200006 / CBS 805.95 / DAOM BR144) TaxID=431595 RepID=K3WA83_GLOUD